MTGWDLVGRGFQLLAQGLESFVDQHMGPSGSDHGDWAGRLAALDQARYGNSRRLSKDDPAVLLRAIYQEWRNFADVLPREARHYAGELRETRNRWAHHEVKYFTDRRAKRALETMYLLLAETGDAGAVASRAIGELIEQPSAIGELIEQPSAGVEGTPNAGDQYTASDEPLAEWERELLEGGW